MSERRTSVRHKSLLRGRIYFNNRQSVVDCLVREMSGGGAKLIFADTASIPDKIDRPKPREQGACHPVLGCRYREVSHVAVDEKGLVSVTGVALVHE